MTKQEVQNKIKYYENLAKQYRREIQNLENQISSQNSRINQLNNQIGTLRSKRQKLEGEESELQRLRIKFQGLRDDFSARQSKRVSGFNKNIAQPLNVKFIESYIIGMRNLLTGQEYRKTYNGITSAIDKVAGKIRSKQSEIASVKGEISNAQRNLDNAYNQISSYRRRIDQRNSDYYQCKQQIRHWENQLQYAT